MKKLITILSLVSSVSFGATKNQVIDMQVTDKGFEPSTIDVPVDTSVTLNITRKTEATCATEIKVPSKKISKSLPLNQKVTVVLGKLQKGEIRFSCGMDMISGIVNVQ